MAGAEATNVNEKDLVVIRPIRLDTLVNSDVFQHEVLQDPDKAQDGLRCDVVGAARAKPGEVNVPVVLELSLPELTQVRTLGVGTKGVELRTQWLRLFCIQVLELVEWASGRC